MKKKMNGILVGLIVITVLFGVLAPAQAQLGVPFTISGQVFDTDGTTPVDGVTMTVTDLETGSKVNTEVTEQGGWYSINLGNLKPNPAHNAGDTIQIHADDGAGKTNTTEVSRAESSPQRVNVILVGGAQPILTTIEVSPSSATVNVNATEQFNATAKDQDGNVMPDVVITWTSSNETVGTITDAGLLTALVVGETTVTAANETVNGTATVTVQSGVQPVLTTIDVSPSSATLNVNATEQFNATAKDQDGNVMPDVVITWTSSNETVGTIMDAGLLTALAIGQTTVTAANETVNGTATVTVQEVVPQNLTVTNLEADPNTGVNADNPTTVSATITSSAELEMITLFAIDTKNYQPKDYMLYAEFLEPKEGTDNYSAEWDATVFTVQGETTSSGTKPVFVIKADEFETIQIPEYLVIGNLTINATTEPKYAMALFNEAFELTEIKTEVNASSFESGTTTFTPFAVDATERANMTDTFDLLWCFEDLDPVTLTGAAPDYNISLVKEPVLKGDYVVGMGAMDAAGDEDDDETTVSVSTTEDYAVSISTDDAEETVAPNVKATYTLTVENEGTKTDNYTLSLDSKADLAELNIVNITLDAGETQNVSLNVSDAREGTYTVNVTVESQTDTNVTDMVSTLTTVKTTPAPTPQPRIRRGGGGGGGGVSDSDGDGYSDIEEITVGTDPYDPCDPNPACLACIGEAIIAEVITTPEPTPYDPTKGITPPTTKPVATIPPLEEPEEPTPKPPGFEAVFAIAGLLAVAYLVQRRKK